jgi:putative NIF3 family GTP cyclohydrolase 1 type 2
VNTDRLMRIALEMAGLEEIPGDSAIHRPGDGIERVLFGIDLKAAELAIASARGFDCAISHHPVGGSSTLRFHEVLGRHVDQMVGAGVPRDVAEETMRATIEERRVLSSMANYDHDPSVAELLGISYLNVHTPLDEIGRRRMAEAAAGLDEDATVAELVDRFYETFGEFRNAATEIEVRVGRPENRIGRVVVSHGAGTNGGYPVAKAYFDHGIDTVIYIHCRPAEAKKLADAFGETKNLIVTGHIASDSVGINPYVDRLREEGLDVTTFSGIVPPK